MKRTEKSKANSRQSRKANQRTATELRRSTRRSTRISTQYRVRLQQPIQPAMQMSSSNPSSQPAPDVQQVQYALKLDEVITTVPKIDFDEEIVEYEKIIPTARKQRFRKSRRP